MNLLQNPGFEEGWYRKTHTGQEFGEIYVPLGWTAFWKEGGPVPHDPANKDGYGRPEMHVIEKVAPFLNPPRIRSGSKSLKYFTFYRIHDAGVYQQVSGIQIGSRLVANFWAHAWSSVKDDPSHSSVDGDGYLNFDFMAGIDPFGGTDPWSAKVIWGAGTHLYDYFQQSQSVEAVAKATTVTMFIRSKTLWPFKHCDAYIDDALLEVKAVAPNPDPLPVPADYTYPVIIKGPKTYPHANTEAGALEASARMVARKSPFPFMKILVPQVHDLPSVFGLHSVTPTTPLVIRMMKGKSPDINVEGPSFDMDPVEYMENLEEYMAQCRALNVYWELWNEQNYPDKIKFANFTIGCMEWAEARGYRLCVCGFSSGVPEYNDWVNIYTHTRFFDVCIKGKHIIGLHAYARSTHPQELNDHVRRPYKFWEDYLVPNNKVVPYVFTELGITEIGHGGIWDHPEFPTVDAILNETLAIDDVLAEKYYCLGGASYTFGAGNDRYSYNKIWSEYCDALLTRADRLNNLPPEGTPSQQYDRYVIMADPTYMDPRQLDEAFDRGRIELRTTTPSWNDAIVEAYARPTEWRTNTVHGGPMPKDLRQKYLDWAYKRDPETQLIFDDTAPYQQVIKAFGQGDDPWGWVRMGLSQFTMTQAGCLVTSLASVMTQKDPTMDPLKLVAWLNSHGGFLSDGRLILAKPTEFVSYLKFVDYPQWPKGDGIAAVRAALKRGPVIIKVEYDYEDPKDEPHFVVVTRELGDDDLEVMDPWVGDFVSLMDNYGLTSLSNSIFGMVDYRILTTSDDEEEVPPTSRTLLGFNDPLNTGAYTWLDGLRVPSLLVVPLMLDRGAEHLTIGSPNVRVIGNLRWSYAKDNGGQGTMPLPGPMLDTFIQRCIQTIKDSPGVWGWTFLNEANNPREFPIGGNLSPEMIANAFNRVRAGAPGARLAVGALDPFNAAAGNPGPWLTQILERVTSVDFLDFHGYVRGPDYLLVNSFEKFADDPLKWQGLNYSMCVTEFLKFVPTKYRKLPLYVTEFNHLWKTVEPDWGWVQDQRAADVIMAAYGSAIARGWAGLALYRWSGDQWSVDSNMTVLGTVRRLLEEFGG